MDANDHRIVRLLHRDARLTQERIGREINLSRPAVHDRIRRLEENKVILGYQAIVDWGKLGQTMTTFIWVRTSGGNCHEIANAIMKLSTLAAVIEECHLVTGDWCLLLKARTTSTATLQGLIDRLREMPRIRNTMTTLVLSSVSSINGCAEDTI